MLNDLLTPLRVSYEVVGNRIRIAPNGSRKYLVANPACVTCFPVQAAEQTVSGTVTDESGTGLPGVSVVLKGS